MATEIFARMADILRRRWILLFLPVLVILPAAYFVVKMAPVKYSTKSVVLLQSANRTSDGNSLPRGAALEQIGVIEAWLKSDHVLDALIPEVSEGPQPSTAQAQFLERVKLRHSLTFELIGNSVLEVRLEGGKAEGLGRRLEIIISRMLEGVLNPEDGILSAEQMILARRADAAREAEEALTRAILDAGLGSVSAAKTKLGAIHQIERGSGRFGTGNGEAGVRQASIAPAERSAISDGVSGVTISEQARRKARADAERAALSKDAALVQRLERLYANYDDVQSQLDTMVKRARSSVNTYVRVFDAPDKLIVIGRPRDPLMGEKPARKHAMAAVIGIMMLLGGLVLLLEMVSGRIYGHDEYEDVTGVPLIARLPKR